MKKVVFLIGASVFAFFAFAHQAMASTNGKPALSARIAVFNLTQNDIHLQCTLLQEGATMSPSGDIPVLAGEMPTIDLTYPAYGKVIQCFAVDQAAWFIYSVGPRYQEFMEISPPSGGPTFHYDDAYPGALTFS